jgi:ribosome-associated protein
MEEIAINSAVIQLDQLLKWAGIVESGGQVRPLIEDGLVMINNEVAAARRKKIYPGDIVSIKNIGVWKVIYES